MKTDAPKYPLAPGTWHFTAVIAVAVTVALPVSRIVTALSRPSVGDDWAFAAGLVAAAAVGGLVGLAARRLVKSKGTAPAA